MSRNEMSPLTLKGIDRPLLNLCRFFYLKYPQICATVSHKFGTPTEILISRLSFSHIREIMSLDDPFERFFYEFECIKGAWSVRKLRRQIVTNHSHSITGRYGNVLFKRKAGPIWCCRDKDCFVLGMDNMRLKEFKKGDSVARI